MPKDTDNDGLSDVEEKSLGTFFTKTDSDKDGLSDGDEVNKYFTDPLAKDSDLDGLTDVNEVFLGTNPNKIDTDGDGYTDGFEISKGFNPCGDGQIPTDSDLKNACSKFQSK